ncbi:MAG: uncharacterized membrane protein YqaE (UPF0057 family) [Halopseudomonas sp.]
MHQCDLSGRAAKAQQANAPPYGGRFAKRYWGHSGLTQTVGVQLVAQIYDDSRAWFGSEIFPSLLVVFYLASMICNIFIIDRGQTMAVTATDPIKIIFSILLPPVGVFLEVGFKGHFWLNILLTLFGFIPGIIHALYVILKH